MDPKDSPRRTRTADDAIDKDGSFKSSQIVQQVASANAKFAKDDRVATDASPRIILRVESLFEGLDSTDPRSIVTDGIVAQTNKDQAFTIHCAKPMNVDCFIVFATGCCRLLYRSTIRSKRTEHEFGKIASEDERRTRGTSNCLI